MLGQDPQPREEKKAGSPTRANHAERAKQSARETSHRAKPVWNTNCPASTQTGNETRSGSKPVCKRFLALCMSDDALDKWGQWPKS